ncbi:MAG: hypothetical protein J0I09_03130 [Sphingobacteriia bacterium]|nr:hypothetical protein [Sphingobacteriia bacterium]
MITPKDIFDKANKQFIKTVTALLKGQEIFPLIIPANKSLQGTNYSDLKAAIVPLYQQSKEVKGKGYSIDWKEKMIEGTKQKIPAKIYFETIEDLLFYTKRHDDYQKIQKSDGLLAASFPQLTEWAKDNIVFLLSQSENLVDLIKVCNYFKQNQPPHNLYLRELPIEVHSKFIEDNIASLRKILDLILPAKWIDNNSIDFLNRYNIKKPNIYTQIRVLDESLRPAIGFNELALTLDDSALLGWNPEKVFIIENKACFLSFPNIKNAVAIFGEGFKSRISKHITWLANAELYCWFDLDAAGFEMLNIIRQYYPNARSIFMDKITYKTFNQFSVTSSYRKLPLNNLQSVELKLYEFLQANNKRLEQERITNQYIKEHLDDYFSI